MRKKLGKICIQLPNFFPPSLKQKKKKKAPPVEEKPKPKPKPKQKQKKDTIENLKKYLAKEEDKKVDYDAIIRPSEPIRNFQDIAKKTAALALLEKNSSNDNDGEGDANSPDLEAARRRGGMRFRV